MEFTSKEVLKSALGGFFRDNFYKDAVIKLKQAIKEKENYKNHWEGVIKACYKQRIGLRRATLSN